MLRLSIVRFSSSLALSLVLAAPVLAAASSHTVVRGDTLSSISEREHVSIEQIVRLNHIDDVNFLREGEVLRLSAAPAARRKLSAKILGRTQATSAHRAKPRRAHRTARHGAAQIGTAQVAERQALWIALHTGSSAPDFSGNISFAAAQRALALEVRLTRTALRYLGVPYAWGGESFSGVDCSGLVQAVFHHNGIELPRTADAQFEVGHRVSEGGLQPGDLVFFETYAEGASHVGIYLGEGQFVHASSSNGVRVDSLSEAYFSNRFIGARREAI